VSYRHALALSLAVEALKQSPPKNWSPRTAELVVARLSELANETQREDEYPDASDIEAITGEKP
jgi:hypothetical protein